VVAAHIRAPGFDAVDPVDGETAEAVVARAADLAAGLLGDVGTRLAHSRRVAIQACVARDLLSEPWRSALVPAAWLHDVGYNAELALVGFHPLDGARYLRLHGWAEEVCRLVAWHTGAGVEAELRDLGPTLVSEFAIPPAEPSAAMAWADLTSSPTGECWSAEERLAEILRRYQPGTLVHRAVTASRPGLLSAASRIDEQLFPGQPI
jgi:hypothetical protein